jgi:hypothetical protein
MNEMSQTLRQGLAGGRFFSHRQLKIHVQFHVHSHPLVVAGSGPVTGCGIYRVLIKSLHIWFRNICNICKVQWITEKKLLPD